MSRKILVVVVVVYLSGCATFQGGKSVSAPLSGGTLAKTPVKNIPLMTYPAQPPAHFVYYIMVTSWKVRGGYPKVRVDVTYSDDPESPAIFNMSLVQRREIPRGVGSAFISDGVSSFPLEAVSVFLVNPQDKLLRITSNIDGDNFITLLDAKNIVLTFTLDGREFQATPPRKFYMALDEVRKGVNYFK